MSPSSIRSVASARSVFEPPAMIMSTSRSMGAIVSSSRICCRCPVRIILLIPSAVSASTASWTMAASAAISPGSAGAIPTSPGEARMRSRGVVIPTTATFPPEAVVITTLLVMLFGIVRASCPGLTTSPARLLSVLKSKFALRNGNAVPT